MKYKQLLSNSLIAILSQGIGTLASLLTSLVVPKFLGIESFGYWQLFIFYTTYVGFFHFGLCDGVYLKEGGKSKSQLNLPRLNSVFWCGLFYQFLFVVITLLFVYNSTLSMNRKLVFFSSGVVLIFVNASTFLGFVFQAVNETKIYSYSVIVDRLTFACLICLLVYLHTSDFRFYVVAFVISKIFSFLYCVKNSREIFSSGFEGFTQSIVETFRYVSVGIKLMFANIASMLILGIVRFSVDGHWGIKIFGEVSFALSLATFIMQFVMQVSMVLFPALRQSDIEEQKNFYIKISEFLDAVAPFVYFLYFPIVIFLNSWLPQYRQSFSFFAVLLPICVFDGKMDISCTTFFKVFRMEQLLLIINLSTLLLSTLLTYLQVYVFNSLYGALVSVVIVIALRSIVSEIVLCKYLSIRFSYTIIFPILLSISFVLLSTSLDLLKAFFMYSIFMIFMIIIFRSFFIRFARHFLKN